MRDVQDQTKSMDMENYEFTFSAPSAADRTGFIEPDVSRGYVQTSGQYLKDRG